MKNESVHCVAADITNLPFFNASLRKFFLNISANLIYDFDLEKEKFTYVNIKEFYKNFSLNQTSLIQLILVSGKWFLWQKGITGNPY